MDMEGTALFRISPRRADELISTETDGMTWPYRIVGCIELTKTDFENLSTDMLVERDYLEPYTDKCNSDVPADCVLVYPRGNRKGGLLIIPKDNGNIKAAALYSNV